MANAPYRIKTLESLQLISGQLISHQFQLLCQRNLYYRIRNTKQGLLFSGIINFAYYFASKLYENIK